MLDATERIRYACQIALPGFGEAAQERLKAARVVVVGAGGLGCPAAQYLVAAGVGQVTIADFDTVSAGNLHRQILYTPEDVGQLKASVAAGRLARQNPQVVVRAFPEKISPQNVGTLFAGHDLVLDCTDNFEARYLINDAAVLGGKPVVYGAIYQYEGQVALWNARKADGSRSPNYRDLFPEVNAAAVPDCAEGGVLPALAGIIGCMQANTAIRHLTGMADSLAGQLLVFDSVTMQSRSFKIAGLSHTSITKLPQTEAVPCISAAEWAAAGPDTYVVVDVRNHEERKQFPFPGMHIPLLDLGQRWTEIPNGQPILFCCASGRRSAEAVKIWQQLQSGTAAFSLEGGIHSVNNLNN